MENWKPGDRVYVERDDGVIVDCEVRSGPWTLGHGQEVVAFKGMAGGYATDRIRGRVSPENATANQPSLIGPRVPPAAQ